MVKIEKVISLIKDGQNFSQVSRELNCSRNTVKLYFWNYVKNHPVAIPNFWGISEKYILEIMNRKQYGDKVQDIAEDFDLSKSYIYKLIKKWS